LFFPVKILFITSVNIILRVQDVAAELTWADIYPARSAFTTSM